MEKLINAEIEKDLKELFSELKEEVKILFFSRKNECEYCAEIAQLLAEVGALSAKLSYQQYDFDENETERKQFAIDDAPVFVLAGKNGEEIIAYGIRFYGLPSGHEFASLIKDLILVSGRDSKLQPETRSFLSSLKKPVRLQVFVTPTCPYCPQAVILAHQMAMESKMVTADMVEATEFPELASRFNVSGVPQTTINLGAGTVIGAYPEDQLVGEIKTALAL